MKAAVVGCSSMLPYIEAAQRKMGTSWPVYTADRSLHAEPEQMKEAIGKLIASLPAEIDTVLIAMGFCGGVFDHVSFDRRVVLPKADDCVSILLNVDDECVPNRKEMGHLYLYENDPADFSALTLLRDRETVPEDVKGVDPELLFRMWFGNYHAMDIIDTGLNDCYAESYVETAQAEADRIGASLGYAEGSNRTMEKLVAGRWDDQFLVAEKGKLIRHGDIFS